MNDRPGIFFEEVNLELSDFLGDLADPAFNRRALSPASASALRRRQLERLENNILCLRRKQEEFNRKMEDYIRSIQLLSQSLRDSLARESAGFPPQAPPDGGTQVRCLVCGEEKVFSAMLVIAAHDSMESLHQPTELLVDDGGKLKKGSFRCPTCGNQQLLIRDAARRAS